MAPTTSSTRNFSNRCIPTVHNTPPITPTSIANSIFSRIGAAVIDTRPLIAPLSTNSRLTFPCISRAVTIAASTPPQAARLVLTNITAIQVTSAAEPNLSCEPPLKPNQPSQRMNTPSVTSGILEAGVARTVPSSRNFPSLGPTKITPARAAQPPVECTMVEPAKSENPYSESQPPPHVQAPTTG